MRTTFLFSIFSLLATLSLGQSGSVYLHPNAGQWPDEIAHIVERQDGAIHIREDGFGFNIHNQARTHDLDHDHVHQPEEFKGHFLKQTFFNASWNGQQSKHKPSEFYRNYYLGKDQSKWAAKVYAYQKVKLTDFIPGVDWVLEGGDGSFKYGFELAPGTSPQVLDSRIEGATSVQLIPGGILEIEHSMGSFQQTAPLAWQWIEGDSMGIECAFALHGDVLSFEVSDYDENYPLFIDPNLIFSSYSGGTSDNWGSTATGDDDGNVYAAGTVYGQGFPVNVGTYDDTFNGGTIDVGILKFNATGSSLLYATFLGGSNNEFPSSMICNGQGELYVLGLTGSTDFPVNNGYDMFFGGGSAFMEYFVNYSNGSDMFVSRLAADGTALLNSTYIGGNGNDGVNIGDLNYNYGDSYRGEVTLDELGNVYVASTSNSINFPQVGAGGSGLSGPQGAVACKLTSNLSTMLWSRYFSGADVDAGYSIQVSSTGEAYLTGGTKSSNLGLSGVQSSLSGDRDGFIARFNGNTGALIGGTYVGTFEYDQTYFVQIDIDDNVYVLGQTSSNMPITAGRYGVPNSGQFIRKFNTNLSAVLWNTVLGSGSGDPKISPTAFLVSDCYEIYLSGWGGSVNNASQVVGSSTNGFPVTPNAYQSTTTGSNFYIAVLSANALNLKYGTYFGGMSTNSPNHVDGGSSRFDKKGNIYHTVCGGCGGYDDGFSTTPGAYSQSNNSTNCNIAAFKFALGTISALPAQVDPILCLSRPVDFQNFTQFANTYYWDFGDGNTSNEQSPSHQYASAGTYTITFIASDSLGCFESDTSVFVIDIGDFSGAVVQPGDSICPGTPFQLEASGGATYAWTPAQFLDDPTSPTPTANVSQTTVFTVIVTDSCGADTLDVELMVFTDTAYAYGDTSLCFPETTTLYGVGGASYTWSPSLYLDDPNSETPFCEPDSTTMYTVDIITPNGCEFRDSVFVSVFHDQPTPVLDDTVLICRFSSEIVTASGGDQYNWSPPQGLNTTFGPTVQIYGISDRYYVCEFVNACGSRLDSIFVDVEQPEISAFDDTTVCRNDTVFFYATGGETYRWSNPSILFQTTGDSVTGIARNPSFIEVVGTDVYGCSDSARVQLKLFPDPVVLVNPTVFAIYGEPVELKAVGNGHGGSYLWTPPDDLSCPTCEITLATPNKAMTYTVFYTDHNGCKNDASVKLDYSPIIYIPNVFTPDDNKFNDFFSIQVSNVYSYELNIYNRWGEMIKVITLDNPTWDGTYKGKLCPDGAYTYTIRYTDFEGREYDRVGHLILAK